MKPLTTTEALVRFNLTFNHLTRTAPGFVFDNVETKDGEDPPPLTVLDTSLAVPRVVLQVRPYKGSDSHKVIWMWTNARNRKDGMSPTSKTYLDIVSHLITLRKRQTELKDKTKHDVTAEEKRNCYLRNLAAEVRLKREDCVLTWAHRDSTIVDCTLSYGPQITIRFEARFMEPAADGLLVLRVYCRSGEILSPQNYLRTLWASLDALRADV